MFMVVVEVSQGLERFGEMILATSWMEEYAPSAWAANFAMVSATRRAEKMNFLGLTQELVSLKNLT